MGRNAGVGFGKARAQHLGLDRIDREHGDGEGEGQALRQRALCPSRVGRTRRSGSATSRQCRS
jgi:hypothetical protein